MAKGDEPHDPIPVSEKGLFIDASTREWSRFERLALFLCRFLRLPGRLVHRDSRVLVGIVLVLWDADRSKRALTALADWVDSVSYPCTVAIVNNSSWTLNVALRESWSLIVGSNRSGEFSGYDEGLATLVRSEATCVVLLNDRCLEYSPQWPAFLNDSILQLASCVGVVVGHSDTLRLPLGKVDAHNVCRYLRTSGLAIATSLLSQLFPLEKLVDVSSGLDCAEQNNYDEFIHSYLTGELSPPEHNWYASLPESQWHDGALIKKKVNIEREHKLTLRVEREKALILGESASARLAMMMVINPPVSKFLIAMSKRFYRLRNRQ